jgi:hypothetical protein
MSLVYSTVTCVPIKTARRRSRRSDFFRSRLGIALIVAGLTLVCGSMIFRLFTRREPAFSEESFELGLFRINDEMWREPDKL